MPNITTLSIASSVTSVTRQAYWLHHTHHAQHHNVVHRFQRHLCHTSSLLAASRTSCPTSQCCPSLPASPLYVIRGHCTRQVYWLHHTHHAMGRITSQLYPGLHPPLPLFTCHQFMIHAHAHQGLAAAKKNCEGDACLNFFCTNTTGAGRNRRYADGSENGRHRRGSDSVVVVYK